MYYIPKSLVWERWRWYFFAERYLKGLVGRMHWHHHWHRHNDSCGWYAVIDGLFHAPLVISPSHSNDLIHPLCRLRIT